MPEGTPPAPPGPAAATRARSALAWAAILLAVAAVQAIHALSPADAAASEALVLRLMEQQVKAQYGTGGLLSSLTGAEASTSAAWTALERTFARGPVAQLASWAMNVGWWWRMTWKRIFTKSGVFCYTPENQLYFFPRNWQVIFVRPFQWKGQKRPLGIKRADVAGIAYFFSLAIYWIKRLDRP